MWNTNRSRFGRLLGVIGLLMLASIAAADKLRLESRASFGLISKADIGRTSRVLKVSAVGATQVTRVYSTVGGVLFQATAQPDDSLRGRSIRLTSVPEGRSDAKLHVTIGEKEGVSSAPAWVWVKAAQFARSDWTAAGSLYSDPVTADEKRFKARRSPKYWIGYHPVVDDSLIGFLLFTADGMFVDDNPDFLRRVTTAIPGLHDQLGYGVTFNETQSRDAARQFRSFLRPIQWETYMLNDVDSTYKIEIADGALVITGRPRYHFGTTAGGRFNEITRIRQFFDLNEGRLSQINPIVYKAVFEFARHVAFFNYVEKQDQAAFAAFVDGLDDLAGRIPSIDTPAAWTPKSN